MANGTSKSQKTMPMIYWDDHVLNDFTECIAR